MCARVCMCVVAAVVAKFPLLLGLDDQALSSSTGINGSEQKKGVSVQTWSFLGLTRGPPCISMV